MSTDVRLVLHLLVLVAAGITYDPAATSKKTEEQCRLTEVAHGEIRLNGKPYTAPSLSRGQKITVHCNSGYQIVSKKRTVSDFKTKCRAGKKLRHPLPACEKLQDSDQCQLTEIEHGEIRLNGTLYTESSIDRGQKITVHCNSGYEILSGSRTMAAFGTRCKKRNTLRRPLPICVNMQGAEQCQLTDVENGEIHLNGTVISHRAIDIGQKVTVVCKRGYRMVSKKRGKSPRLQTMCVIGNRMKPTLPVCTRHGTAVCDPPCENYTVCIRDNMCRCVTGPEGRFCEITTDTGHATVCDHDLRDHNMLPAMCRGNDPCGRERYFEIHDVKDTKFRIHTYTSSDSPISRTKANVFLRLYGKLGASDEVQLQHELMGKRNMFRRGSTDTFQEYLLDVGQIGRIQVRLNGTSSENNGYWRPSKLFIYDFTRNRYYLFDLRPENTIEDSGTYRTNLNRGNPVKQCGDLFSEGKLMQVPKLQAVYRPITYAVDVISCNLLCMTFGPCSATVYRPESRECFWVYRLDLVNEPHPKGWRNEMLYRRTFCSSRAGYYWM